MAIEARALIPKFKYLSNWNLDKKEQVIKLIIPNKTIGIKKKKKRLTKSTGYKFVTEALDDKDLKQINKLIRDVVGDIIRDIWLKRNAWKQEIINAKR